MIIQHQADWTQISLLRPEAHSVVSDGKLYAPSHHRPPPIQNNGIISGAVRDSVRSSRVSIGCSQSRRFMASRDGVFQRPPSGQTGISRLVYPKRGRRSAKSRHKCLEWGRMLGGIHWAEKTGFNQMFIQQNWIFFSCDNMRRNDCLICNPTSKSMQRKMC